MPSESDTLKFKAVTQLYIAIENEDFFLNYINFNWFV